MRDESRKRLERALLMRKLKWAGVGGAVATMVAGLFYIEGLDASVKASNAVSGTVVYLGPPLGKYKAARVAGTDLEVDIKLDDARIAHLLSPRDKAPKLGDHITIAEKVHGSGRHTFGWR